VKAHEGGAKCVENFNAFEKFSKNEMRNQDFYFNPPKSEKNMHKRSIFTQRWTFQCMVYSITS
jgi:hypothetical protein